MSAVSPNTWPAAPVCTKTSFYTNNGKRLAGKVKTVTRANNNHTLTPPTRFSYKYNYTNDTNTIIN